MSITKIVTELNVSDPWGETTLIFYDKKKKPGFVIWGGCVYRGDFKKVTNDKMVDSGQAMLVWKDVAIFYKSLVDLRR